MSYATTNRAVLREHLKILEAYVGYWVLDAEDRKLGSVKEIFVNAYDEPEYIRMKMGFGLRSVLIPVQGITANEERRSLVLQQASGIDGQRNATESLKGMAINLSGNEGVESLNNRQG